MQATVSAFHEASRSGLVLLDDGAELGFSAAALEPSRLRFVRPGQRVRLDVVGDGPDMLVIGLHISTVQP